MVLNLNTTIVLSFGGAQDRIRHVEDCVYRMTDARIPSIAFLQLYKLCHETRGLGARKEQEGTKRKEKPTDEPTGTVIYLSST